MKLLARIVCRLYIQVTFPKKSFNFLIQADVCFQKVSEVHPQMNTESIPK